MKKVLFTLLFFVLGLIPLYSQKHEFLKMPSIKEEDLTKAKSSIDENAPAEILYRSVNFRIDYSSGLLEKKYTCQIKIFNKEEAEEWLDLSIDLMENGAQKELLSKSNASTYNLENGRIVANKVEKNSMYTGKEHRYKSIVKFAFPNVRNGSILEYSYIVTSPFLFAIPKTFIEYKIPSVYTEYILDHPTNISYNVNYSGLLLPKYKDLREDLMYGVNSKTYRYGFENVGAFVVEKFVKNVNNYRTRISAEVNSANFGELKNYSTSWDKIRQKLLSSDDFGGELRKSKITKELIPASVATTQSTMEKANTIFDFVKRTYNWNNESGIYSTNGIKNLINSRTGNAAEINLLLISMFREAGLEANPVIISTVDNGLINIKTPKVTDVNFVIAAVKSNEEYWLYDATSKQSSRNNLPPRDWNETGLLLTKDKIIQLSMNNTFESYSYLTVDAKLNLDSSISGIYRDKDTGAFAMNAKSKYDENPSSYSRYYKDNYAIDFKNLQHNVLENGDFESTMSFTSNNILDKVGKKIIINPLLFLGKTANDFDQVEERRYNIDFLSPISRIKKVTIEIPEGYEIIELPKAKKIRTEDNEIEFSYTVNKQGRSIEVTSQTKIASATYSKEYYKAFKHLWTTLQNSESQLITIIEK